MPETQEQTVALQDVLQLLVQGVAADGALVILGAPDEASVVLAALPPGLTGRRLPISAALRGLCGEGVRSTADVLLPSSITGWLGFRPSYVAATELKLDAGAGCLFFWWKQEPADHTTVYRHLTTSARIVADGTARQASANQLQQMQDRMDVLLENVSLGIVFIDSLRGCLLNSRAATILDLPAETRDTATVVAAMHTTRAACEIETAKEATDAAISSAEYWISSARDTVLRVESHAVGNTHNPGRFWVFTDVKPLWDSADRTKTANRVLERNLSLLAEEMDRRIEAEEELRKYTAGLKQQNAELEVAKLQSELLANQDALTGLANRRRFRRELEDMVGDARFKGGTVVLLYLDLDKFKQVNDSLGHERGDQLLRDVADRLTEVLRKDDVVARLGGDEFACALRISPPTRLSDLTTLLEELRERLKFPVPNGDRTIHVSATIGVAAYPDDAADAVSLLRAADAAMYMGKSQGGAEVVTFGKVTTPI